MIQGKHGEIQPIDHIGCMGEFNINRIICRKLCCLSLRCIIAQNQSMQSEITEEMMAPTDMLMRMQ
jgi:hypothetical protein